MRKGQCQPIGMLTQLHCAAQPILDVNLGPCSNRRHGRRRWWWWLVRMIHRLLTTWTCT